MQSRKPIEYLCEILGFPQPDPHMQDWGIIMADADRVGEFCDVYDATELTGLEKFLLMELIVPSYDDRISIIGHDSQLWERIQEQLKRDWAIHKVTVNYWRMLPYENEVDEDVFPIKFLMRELWQEMESS